MLFCCFLINSWSSCNRAVLTSSDTWSRSAAGVPGRVEYLNEKACPYSISFINERVSSKSLSVSSGKPTIKSPEIRISGRASRIFEIKEI